MKKLSGDKWRMDLMQNPGIERWLRERVVPACDALKADPSRAISAAKVRARLKAEHLRAIANK
jgi:hypothetical protein